MDTAQDSSVLDSYVAAVRAADERLLASGSPFELRRETVLGEPMNVFAARKRTIGELLDGSRDFGDAEHLVFEDGPRITFREHHELVRSVAATLHVRHGVQKGERVAISGANSLGWILVALACARIGAVAVAFNSWWTTSEMLAALELSEPKLLVADAKRRAVLGEHGGALPVFDMESVATELTSEPADTPLPAVDEDDPWALAFTSGTSGKPKAAVLTHRCLIGFLALNNALGARAMTIAGVRPPAVRAPVVRLAVFPLFHISGLSSMITTVALGHKTVWPAGRFDAGRVIALTNQEGITMWGGASTHIVRLMEHPDLPTVDPQQLTSVGIGGSASTPSLIALTEARLPHLVGTFGSGYGMTECGGLATHASNALLRAAADCVGPALPTVELKIVDGSGQSLPDGQVGTICIRSPILMTEYWRNPAANEAAWLPGRWLRTEDYGRLENGLLFLASRQRDLIIRGGENIYPIEVEDCLDGHPDVLESAVFGRDDAEFGQLVHASVVMREGARVTAEDLQRHCADRLAYFKVPATLELRTAPLPRNASGKVLKRLIIEGTEHLAVPDPE